MKKLPLLAAAGAGYVLGARAGRQRYEQIASAARKVADDPRVQRVASRAQDAAAQQASAAAGAAKDKVSSAAATAADKVRGDSSPSTVSPSTFSPSAQPSAQPGAQPGAPSGVQPGAQSGVQVTP